MRSIARVFSIPVLFGSLLFAQPDPKALLRESVKNYDRDWRASLEWAYVTTEVALSGGEKEVNASEVIPIAGTPYDRVIEKNGRKLTGYEARREQEKFERECRLRRNESAADRAARIHKYESQREFVHEVQDAYDAKLIGEETLDGRPAWVLKLTPREAYHPIAFRAAMLKHIQAKLWIDKQDLRWAKAEAHVIDTISIGWVLARIGPGADIVYQQTRVTNGLWMPKQVWIKGVAKIMLVHDKELNQTVTFTGYHHPDPRAVLTAGGATSGNSEPSFP